MGKRGPAAQPTALRLLKGNPGKRPINKREPVAAIGVPPCPDFLDTEAKCEWDRLCPILVRMGVLAECDYMALASLCQSWSIVADAQRQINQLGKMVEGPNGQPVKNPYLSILSEYMVHVRALVREFGLTASSRSGIVTIKTPTESDPWDSL